jgi:hypothetical protein
MKKILFIMLIVSGIFTSCHNADWEFPDYDYTAVYFAYQTPVRTIVLGEDVYDTTLDNEYKCQILATMGGVYENKNNVEISFRVDNSLCAGLTFDGTTDILPMPSNYYSLSSDNLMVIKKGDIMGGVVVQLTDAFFADPLSLKNTYVIPIVMTDVKNADKILTGEALVDNPNRAIAEDWDVVPKDYIMYAVKYINPYHATYLRRGKDDISGDINKTVIRHATYVEKDEIVSTYTRSLNTIELPLEIADADGSFMDCTLLITIDNSGNCTVTSGTEGVEMSGNGKFVSKGEKNSWGNLDRDAIYLNYNLNFGSIRYATTDTLVVRDRGIDREIFTPSLK